jgi:hypothetical protein
MISNGTFQGVITPTTPIGSFQTSRSVGPKPNGSLAPIERLQANFSIISAGQMRASLNGASRPGP